MTGSKEGFGLINQHLQQLRSKDVSARREAIIALGRSNDPAALKPLAEIYRSDPDPSLRDLALKAGRYLKQQMGEVMQPTRAFEATQPTTKEASDRVRRQVEEDDDEEYVEQPIKPEIPRPKRPVTAKDIESSKRNIDAALTLYERGENGKAVRLLQQSIEINPEIIKDNFFLSVASSVTGRGAEDAVAFLLDKEQTTSFARQSARDQVQQRKSKHIESSSETSWMGVGLEALLYIVVNAVGIILTLLVVVQSLQSAMDNPALIAELGIPASTLNSLRSFLALGTGLIIGYGLFYGFLQAIVLFIYGGIVHLAAVTLLQGKGLYRHFMDKLYGFYNKRLLVYYGLIIAATFLTFAAGAPIIAACLSIIAAFFSLWMVFQQLQITAKAYDFGMLGGCLSNVAAGVVLITLMVVLQLALGASLDAAFGSVMR